MDDRQLAHSIPSTTSQLSAPRAAQASNRPPPRGTASYPRKRAVAACQTCRSRRTKCDNKRPSCSFCDKVGAQCIYATVDLSSFDPASLCILKRLDELEKELKSHITASSHSGSPYSPAGSHHPTVASPRASFNGLVPTREFLAPATSESPGPGSYPSIPPRIPALRMTVEDILSWSVFKGRFDSRLDLMQLLQRHPSLRTSAYQSSQVSVPACDLEPSACNTLVENFLRHVFIKNPIFDEASLRRLVSRVCLEGISWDAESCLTLLVCALGSIADPDAADFSAGRSYFAAAQKRIGMLLEAEGLIEAQCYFLVGVFLMCMMQPATAWRLFNQALACCQHDPFATKSYEINRETAVPHMQSSHINERIYWTCWKSEVELRMHLHLPDFPVVGHRYPLRFPAPPDDDISEGDATWFFYLADISLRRLEMNIRETISTFFLRNSAAIYEELGDATTALEQQIQEWTASIPGVLSLRTPPEDDDILKSILRGRLIDCYDVLYWHFLEAAVAHGLQSPTIDTYARKALDCCVMRLNEESPGFRIRHHGTWLMVRACTRSALMVLAALQAERVDLLPARWHDVITTAIYVLGCWKDESGDIADRLEIIQTLWEETK